jgi:hypothetical protein
MSQMGTGAFKMSNRKLPTYEEVRDILHYDPNTGVFTWRNSPRPGWNGKVAGHTDAHTGYRRIHIMGKLHRAHRLAFLYMTGEWPVYQVDHVDLVRTNNAWSNLREATAKQNKHNSGAKPNKVLNLRGITKHRRRFGARICNGGERIYLGSFATAEEAHKAYCEAAERMHGEFARVA